MSTAVAGVLYRAADILEEEKYEWCKGLGGWADDRWNGVSLCMEGALQLAIYGRAETEDDLGGEGWYRRHPAFGALVAYFDNMSPWWYNDAKCQDRTDAVAALRGAALVEQTKVVWASVSA